MWNHAFPYLVKPAIFKKIKEQYHTMIIKLLMKIQNKDFCFIDGYTILKSDRISNMDHMRISGIDPLSVILRKTNIVTRLICAA